MCYTKNILESGPLDHLQNVCHVHYKRTHNDPIMKSQFDIERRNNNPTSKTPNVTVGAFELILPFNCQLKDNKETILRGPL